MFTGIVLKTAPLLDKTELAGAFKLRVETGLKDLVLGESIALNGACLTVAEIPSPGIAEFYVSPETLSKTNLGELDVQSRVNIERALRAADSLSGHWVQGHVDGLAQVVQIERMGESHRLRFRAPVESSRYLVPKGSVTLNGVSLTVNDIQGDEFGILLIPHTWTLTNLSDLKPGDRVNLEVDVLAKYVERLCQPYLKQ